jgi:hypothetical protein
MKNTFVILPFLTTVPVVPDDLKTLGPYIHCTLLVAVLLSGKLLSDPVTLLLKKGGVADVCASAVCAETAARQRIKEVRRRVWSERMS